MGASNDIKTGDIKAAKATYEGFVGIIWVAVPVIIAIVAFVVMLIA
jgi:hypothetical protein